MVIEGMKYKYGRSSEYICSDGYHMTSYITITWGVVYATCAVTQNMN